MPGLGRVTYAQPALAHPRPRSVRVVTSGDGYVLEFTARTLPSHLTPFRLISLVMVVLAVSVALAAATTKDRMWWTEAFSRLGVFGDLSSWAFNGGLVASGAFAVVFALRFRMDLIRLRRRGVSRAAAAIIPVLCIVAGAGIAAVGFIPESANRSLHDASAMTMAAAFTGLVLTSPWLLRRFRLGAQVPAAVCGMVFVATAIAYAGGAMTLALFELIMFVLFFAWLGAVSHGGHRLLNGKGRRR